MSWSRPVFSSNISEVGYDTDSGEMSVTFVKSGKTAVYRSVPESLADELSRAPSVGSMFNSDVKPFYTDFYYR